MFGFVAAVLTISNTRSEAAPYADIVVDANSGNVLHATNPDARRHPASLTKIMTLYLLFEQLEAGKLRLDGQLKVSEDASGQMPTKLGLKPGGTLQVEDAIKGIVTRSANDAAVVVAEAIAGDEDEFAKLMTRKAQSLGMTRTVYKNASGLPDDDQVTTARDQSMLGRAIQERFPKYYRYFSIRSFTFRGETIGNHNHLLGRVDGVDGIKTGYIGASGFNLVTSLHRGNRYMVAVVMGGSSAGSRDARMRELISSKIAEASTKRTTSMFAEANESEPRAVAKLEAQPERKVAVADARPRFEPKAEAKPEAKAEPKFALASAGSVPVRFTPSSLPPAAEPAAPAKARVATGSTEPIQPVVVKTVTVKMQTASLGPFTVGTLPAATPVQQAAAPAPAPVVTRVDLARIDPSKIEASKTEVSRFEVAKAAALKTDAFKSNTLKIEASKVEAPKPEMSYAEPPALPPGARPGVLGVPPVRTAAAEPAPTAPAKPQARSGWMIQVGAYQAEQEAKQRLSAVQSKAAKVLNGADPFTESVDKGGTTYYRARFAGLDRDKAEAACKYLKRNDVECVAIKN
jgi:D-alanyl-D-alanine carboxypeptidase